MTLAVCWPSSARGRGRQHGTPPTYSRALLRSLWHCLTINMAISPLQIFTCTSKGHRKGSQTLGFSQKRSAKRQGRVSFPFSHQESSGFNLPFTQVRARPQDLGSMGLPSPVWGQTPAGYPRNVQKEVTEDQWPRGGQCLRDLGDGNSSPGGRGEGGRRLWFALS